MFPIESKTEKVQRIMKSVLHQLDISIREFAMTIDVNYMQVYNCVVGRNKTIAEEVIVNTVNKFPYISESFLRTGEGNVLKDEEGDSSTDDTFDVLDPSLINADFIKLHNRVIDLLDKVHTREEELDNKYERILLMQEQLTQMLAEIKNARNL